MILLWGLPGDAPLAAVFKAVLKRRAEVAFLDQHDTLKTEIDFSLETAFAGTVRVLGRAIDLAQVRAVYLRPYDACRLASVSGALSQEGCVGDGYAHALAVEEALLSWCEVAPGLVVNRPSHMASNTSKPYQASIIGSQGFRIPDTLITTDPEAAREFRKKHGAVIYKSVSGVRSIVSRMASEEDARLDDVRWCPTQFQELITGEDYRAHVVGEELFTCRIVSAAADYRYARSQGTSIQIEPQQLPEDVAQATRQLAHALGLVVAGVDLRRTPEGQWYCFEVNPSPGFTFYQESTGQPIDEAIARLLVAADLQASEEAHPKPA